MSTPKRRGSRSLASGTCVSYHHVVSFSPWEDSSTTTTIIATTTNDRVIGLLVLVSPSPDRPPPPSPSPSPPLLTGSDRHRHHRGAIAIAAKTNKTRRKAVANVAGGGHSGRKGIWWRWLDEERLWLSKLRVLLPFALALLKGEGKFTARVGRVKIYCRASMDGRRPDGSCAGRGGKTPPKIE